MYVNQLLISCLMAAEAMAFHSPFVAREAETLPKPLFYELKRNYAKTHPLGRYQKYSKHYQHLAGRATSGTTEVTLTNQYLYYSAEIELGTPSQKIDILIDTGSADLWVYSSSNPYCASESQLESSSNSGNLVNCTQAFDYKKSSTFSFNETGIDFYITYGDDSFADGRWGTDVFKIGDITLNNCSVAVALMANSTTPILGIGYEYLESTEQYLIQPSVTTELPSRATATSQLSASNVVQAYSYENVPAQMYAEGKISAYAYSLWLNDLNADRGALLFGGVDHDKYTGNLETVPIVNIDSDVSNTPFQFNIILSSLALVDQKGSESTIVTGNIPVLLDSGTSLSMLPTEHIELIAYYLDYSYNSELELYIGECGVAKTGREAIVFDLSGAKINVNLTEVLFPVTYTDGSTATFTNGDTICYLGMYPASDTYILGDTFLRSAYVVYDLANDEISIANTDYNSTSSNVEAIGSSVPSATKAASYSSSTWVTAARQLSLNSKATFDFGVSVGATATIADSNQISESGISVSSDGTATRGIATGTGTSASGSTSTSTSSSHHSSGGEHQHSPLPLSALIGAASLVGAIICSVF